MKKTVGVSTYCDWKSYGSILQSLGLKEFLLDNNVQSFIIQDKFIDRPKRNKINSVKSFLKFLLNEPLFNRFKVRAKKNLEFISKNLDVKYFQNYCELLNNVPQADFYVAGSDQVFHPDVCSRTFFLDFVADKNKRLSYACSMGILDINNDKKEEYFKLVNNFSHISVREADNIPILKKINSDAKYYNHIDPTFLVDASFWKEKEKKYNIGKGGYILVYPIFWDKKFNKYLKKISKNVRMPIVTLCSDFNRVYGNKKIYDAGVDEFLWLIDNAQYVITSSFHGVAMSIIFRKDFCSVINPRSNSRITSILNKLDITPLTFENILNNDHINYSNICYKISKERDASLKYIKEILNI